MAPANFATMQKMKEAPGLGSGKAAAREDSIEELWLAARDGDPKATDALCRQLRPYLYRVAYAWLQDADEADDVAQEALVRALLEKFWWKTPKNIRAWMSKVAQNLARNKARNRKRRHEILHQADSLSLQARGALSGADKTSLEKLLSAETKLRTEKVLSQLPRRQREVATLRLYGQLSFAEIGDALGVREDNARVVFGQAKKRLEIHLRKERAGAEESAT